MQEEPCRSTLRTVTHAHLSPLLLFLLSLSISLSLFLSISLSSSLSLQLTLPNTFSLQSAGNGHVCTQRVSAGGPLYASLAAIAIVSRWQQPALVWEREAVDVSGDGAKQGGSAGAGAEPVARPEYVLFSPFEFCPIAVQHVVVLMQCEWQSDGGKLNCLLRAAWV